MSWLRPLVRAFDIFVKPLSLFQDLAQAGDLGPGLAALAVTSILFATSSVLAYAFRIPLPAPPLWDVPSYRLLQAVAMPVVFSLGCTLCAACGLGLSRLLLAGGRFRSLLAVCLPALLMPLWPMLWPTELAASLGVLDTETPGFPGFWVRELAPALTVLYMLFLLSLAYWQAQKLLLREAFALAVFSLLPALACWAAILR